MTREWGTARPPGGATAVGVVAALNLAYFVVEIGVALSQGSVSLFADSVDFLEDASISLLVLAGLRWSPAARAKLGMGLAAVILVPSLSTLAVAWYRFGAGTAPDAVALTVTGCGALIVNGTCAILLARSRREGSLMRAAFLSARNDMFANLAIIGAGLVTARAPSPWPDLVVGLGIAILNAGAAHEVFAAARSEHRQAYERD